MQRLWIAAVAALAVGSAAHAAPPPKAELLGAPPIYREIGDWILVCDNTRTCFAKFVARDTVEREGYLSVERTAGPDGTLTVRLESQSEAGIDPKAVKLDGKPATAVFRRVGRTDLTIDGPAALSFLREIRNGDQLTLRIGEETPPISLAGFTAVMLAMDEAQGRLNGVTAIIRQGPGKAGAVPPASASPTVRVVKPRTVLQDGKAFAARVRAANAALLEKRECEPDYRDNDDAWALTETLAVVQLSCRMYAYQSGSLLLTAPRAAPERAGLVILPLSPTDDPADFMEDYAGHYIDTAGWDPETATFTEAARGRGFADCGSITTWGFDGSRWRLTGMDHQGRCGGPPGDWPTLYRTRIVYTGG